MMPINSKAYYNTLFQVTGFFFLFSIKVQWFIRDPVIKERQFQKSAKNKANSRSHAVQIKASVLLHPSPPVVTWTLSNCTMWSSSVVFLFVLFFFLYKMLTVKEKHRAQCIGELYFGINNSCVTLLEQTKMDMKMHGEKKQKKNSTGSILVVFGALRLRHKDMTDAWMFGCVCVCV